MTREQLKQKKENDEKKLVESLKNKPINGKQKGEFRKTSIWKSFRKLFYIRETKTLKNGKKRDTPNNDALTLRPLTRTFNLHHMSLDSRHYTDISDKSKFIALNSKSHSLLHYAYSEYCKDKDFLKRLEKYVLLMYKLNNGKDLKDFK